MDPFLSPSRWSAIVRRHVTIRRLLPALGLIFYALFLGRFMGGFATGADQSGYLNLARLLGTGRVSTAMRCVPELRRDQVPLFTYVPLGFNPNSDHLTLNPVYPPGLPLMLAAVFAACHAAGRP